MYGLTVGIFEHLIILAKTDVDQRVKYTENILTGPALKKYRDILLVCKDRAKNYTGDHWMLEESKYVSMEDFGLGPRWWEPMLMRTLPVERSGALR